MGQIIRIKSITELSKLFGLPEPRHPLINIYYDEDLEKVRQGADKGKFFDVALTSDFYLILFKNNKKGSMIYGKTSYDFQNGSLVFLAPNQVTKAKEYDAVDNSGAWYLAFHPDLLRHSNIHLNIDKYSFFSYEVNEALHLSVEEQNYLTAIIHQIEKEYSGNMDKHTHHLIISNIELLLNNCLRYYDRQFYTRTGFNKDIVSRFDNLLKSYFEENEATLFGLPTVSYFGKKMNFSPNYLSDLLKKETGRSAKSHINEFLIKKIKTALLSSNNTVSTIASELGFEHPQSLTRFFKNKTGITPKAYRNLN